MRHHLSLSIFTAYLALLHIHLRTIDARMRVIDVSGTRNSPLQSSQRWGRSSDSDRMKTFSQNIKFRVDSTPKERTADQNMSNKNISGPVCNALNGYPHPNRCDRYYRCIASVTGNYTLSFEQCPSGNYYNIDERKCSEGTCRYESFPGEAQWANGFTTHPSCNMYYTTQSRNFKMILAEHKCPAGQHFNNETNKCVDGDCDAKSPPTDLPTAAPEGFVQQNCLSYNNVPHPTQCNLYSVCNKEENKVSYIECGVNSYFDRKVKGCTEGTCRYEAYPGECNGEKSASFPDENCDTSFKQCEERAHVFLVIEKHCEPGKHYGMAEKVCVDGQGQCVPQRTTAAPLKTTVPPKRPVSTVPVKTTIPPKRPVATTPITPETTKKPDPTDPPRSEEDCDPTNCTIVGQCNYYKYCKGTKDVNLPPNKQTGKFVEGKCDVGLWFNPDSPAVKSQDDAGAAAVCDKWSRINEEIRKDYLVNCVCNYYPVGDCSEDFLYQEEVPEGSGKFRNQTKSCPKGLIWNQAVRTCSLACNVKSSADEPCGSCEGNENEETSENKENIKKGEQRETTVDYTLIDIP